MKPTKLQKLTRRRALTLSTRTASWVVPHHVSVWIDQGNFDKAKEFLAQARIDWPNDPEITRTETLIAFLCP